MRSNWLAFFIVLALSGCGTTTVFQDSTSTIRDTTITVVPPAIVDTLTAVVRPDSTVEAVSIRPSSTDTLIVVRYFPKEHRVFVRAIPDTVRVAYRDTIQVVRNTITQKPSVLAEALSSLTIIIIVAGLIYLIGKLIR